MLACFPVRRKLMAGMMVGDVGGSNPRQMSSILSDQDRKAAALPIEVFGEPVVSRVSVGK